MNPTREESLIAVNRTARERAPVARCRRDTPAARELKPPVEITRSTRQANGSRMKFILTTHNVTLTEAIEQHILDCLDKLDHIDRWLIDARVAIEKDHTGKAPDKTFKCGIRLGVRGNDLFAEDKNADLYAAIDAATKKLEQQIRQKHSKAKAKKHKVASRLKEKARAKADKAE
jgi:ribosomal subunit interface protein